MLVKNCSLDTSVNLDLEKDGKVFSVTVFPKVISTFLKEDIFNYIKEIDPLVEKLLSLQNVDFNLNQNGKIVKQLLKHCDDRATSEDYGSSNDNDIQLRPDFIRQARIS